MVVFCSSDIPLKSVWNLYYCRVRGDDTRTNTKSRGYIRKNKKGGGRWSSVKSFSLQRSHSHPLAKVIGFLLSQPRVYPGSDRVVGGLFSPYRSMELRLKLQSGRSVGDAINEHKIPPLLLYFPSVANKFQPTASLQLYPHGETASF